MAIVTPQLNVMQRHTNGNSLPTNAREATQKKQHEKNIRKNRAQAFFIFFLSNPRKCLYLPSQQLLFRNLKMAYELEN
jgi:hypothetical protein